MSFLTDFPHTDTYEGDIGWLIKEYKRLIAEYDALNAKYQQLIDLQDTLQKAIDSIDPKIEAAINSALAEIDAKFAELTAQMLKYQAELKAYIDAQLSDFKTEINGKFAPMQKQIDDVLSAMDALTVTMQNFQNTINLQVRALTEQVNTLEDTLKGELTEYIDNAIAEWSKELPLVTNPVNGESVSVDVALQSVYHDYIDRDSTVENVTKGYTDETERILREYFDNQITFLANTLNDRTLFRSPVTGLTDSATHLLQWICEQLKNQYTAGEIDDMLIPAYLLEANNISCFDFEWTHFAQDMFIPLTVAEIAAAEIPVADYVAANVSIRTMITSRVWFDNLREGVIINEQP